MRQQTYLLEPQSESKWTLTVTDKDSQTWFSYKILATGSHNHWAAYNDYGQQLTKDMLFHEVVGLLIKDEES